LCIGASGILLTLLATVRLIHFKCIFPDWEKLMRTLVDFNLLIKECAHMFMGSKVHDHTENQDRIVTPVDVEKCMHLTVTYE
jgi:hypothetical protein